MFWRSFVVIAVWVCLAGAGALQAQIYADVTLSGGVTGTFRITLEPAKAPVAVANFIGLATGQNGWIETTTGRLRKDPYYNGLTFHRVVAGFVSQTGSRSGDGTDGPGYTFANEIDPTLSHATPYTVAMANSGGIFSNGSQFYITTPNSAAFLDGSYTIFGRVTSGTAVCDALNAVPTSSNVPVTPVVISSVVVGGSSLASFNLQPAALPRVVGGKPVMKINGSSFALGYDRQPYSTYFGSNSANLSTWSRFVNAVYFHAAPPAVGDIDVTALATGGRQFFQLPRVDYSQAYNTLMPASIANKTFTFPGLFGTVQVQMTFNGTGNGGTYTYELSGGQTFSGTVTEAFYASGDPEFCIYPAYTAYLYVKWDGENPVQIAFDRLEYSATGSGVFLGRTNVTGSENILGTFTSTP